MEGDIKQNTICTNCIHLDQRGSGYHDYYCNSPKIEYSYHVNCITGQQEKHYKDSMGCLRLIYNSERGLPNCQEINHGKCPFYEPHAPSFLGRLVQSIRGS